MVVASSRRGCSHEKKRKCNVRTGADRGAGHSVPCLRLAWGAVAASCLSLMDVRARLPVRTTTVDKNPSIPRLFSLRRPPSPHSADACSVMKGPVQHSRVHLDTFSVYWILHSFPAPPCFNQFLPVPWAVVFRRGAIVIALRAYN